jgi:hypothetical protein
MDEQPRLCSVNHDPVLGPYPRLQVHVQTSVHMDDDKLALLISGGKASYFFDTGANLSTISESDALRFAMEIQEAKGGVTGDVHGNTVSYRIGVAKSLVLGGIELSNVAFLVSSDEQQPFVDMKPGQRGLIGLPVLLALGSITWTREGVFEADRSPLPMNLPAANMFFEGLSLIMQARFDRRVALQAAHIPETQQRTESKWFYGNLGIDLFRQAQRVTINFKTMTLKLDNIE